MKIKSLLYTALASVLLFASCDINKQPVFDDGTQAFVAFSSASGVVKEAVDGNPDVIELKLSVASAAGVATNVTFATSNENYGEALRAEEGVDYRVLRVETYQEIGVNRENLVVTEFTAESEKVVKFDADHRFASIYIETVDNDVQGGDKKFDVVLTNSTNCDLGAHKTFAVTISDDEDPINTLVGNYTATAGSAFEGYPDETWDVTISRDDEDETKLWIHPICLFGGLGAASIYPVYGVVDVVAGTIQVPFSQCVYGGEGQSYNMVIAGVGNTPQLSGAAVANFTIVDKDVTIAFTQGIGVGNIAADEWWYQAPQPPTFEKK